MTKKEALTTIKATIGRMVAKKKNKKKGLIIPACFLLTIVLLSSQFSKQSPPKSENLNSSTPHKRIDESQRSVLDSEDGQKENHRLLRIDLLKKENNNSNQIAEGRNIFTPNRTDLNDTPAPKSRHESQHDMPKTQPIAPMGRFPYKLIGIIKIHKSETTKIAVIYNGSENVLLSEGDMIDPLYRVKKINENHIDVIFVETNSLIIVEIDGS